MSQLDLFNTPPTLPYQPHSDTSRDAAESCRESAETMRSKVLAFIRLLGAFGATDEGICTALGMNPSTARPRRVELVERGLVMSSGRTRETQSGRRATVWIASLSD